jgi:hypothetical protein
MSVRYLQPARQIDDERAAIRIRCAVLHCTIFDG